MLESILKYHNLFPTKEERIVIKCCFLSTYMPICFISLIYTLTPYTTYPHVGRTDISTNRMHPTNNIGQTNSTNFRIFAAFDMVPFHGMKLFVSPPFRIHVLSIFAKAFTIKNLPVMDR